MNARLVDVRFTSRGTDGWTTPPLEFGRILTLVLGPNGAGKTPLLKGIAFALGHHVQIPADIRNRCRSVILTLGSDSQRLVIEREITDGLFCTVTQDDEAPTAFEDERSFSEFLIARLGIPARSLAGKNGGVVDPYMSVLVPMFWVDQDNGWRNLYCALSTHNFIADQQEEIARWLLGVPPRHKAVDKSAFAEAKARHASLLEQVAIKRNTLTAVRREIGTGGAALDELQRRRDEVLAELRTHTSVLELLAQSHSSLDEKVAEALRKRDAAKFACDATERRAAELHRVRQELMAEVEILATNETAAQAFRSLCGNENCQFFRRDESYGRRLLYLKDQLKDFQTSQDVLDGDTRDARKDLSDREEDYRRALSEKRNSSETLGDGRLVAGIDGATKRLSEVNLDLERLRRLGKEEERLEALVRRTLEAEAYVNELRPSGGGHGNAAKFGDAQRELTRAMNDWLNTLRTQNLPKEVGFDENLRLHLGGERFSDGSSYSGSTRTRIVLAYHAAMIEVSLKLGGSHPGFVILDAPKQHELHAADLSAYVTRFRDMSAKEKSPVQLVVGATDDFIDEHLADAIWRPTFGAADSPRFFGDTPRT